MPLLNPLPLHQPVNHQFLPLISVVDFEYDFIIRKVEVGKDNGNLAKIMNHKGKLWTFSHDTERLLYVDKFTISLQHV